MMVWIAVITRSPMPWIVVHAPSQSPVIICMMALIISPIVLMAVPMTVLIISQTFRTTFIMASPCSCQNFAMAVRAVSIMALTAVSTTSMTFWMAVITVSTVC